MTEALLPGCEHRYIRAFFVNPTEFVPGYWTSRCDGCGRLHVPGVFVTTTPTPEGLRVPLMIRKEKPEEIA